MTTSTTLHRIMSVEPGGDQLLTLVWDDGAITTVDLTNVISQGGVFVALADPATFAQAAVDTSGRFITFPGDIDFCADALRLAGQSGSPAKL